MDAADASKRCERRRVVFGLFAFFLCAGLFGTPAWADRGFDRDRGGFDRRGDERAPGRFAYPDRRPDRDAAREERRERRMSDEQRQQLRRDIDEAGRDIYRRHPRRFRD